MATTATPYGTFYTDLGNGVHTLNSDTQKVALLTDSYTPDLDANTFVSDVLGYETFGDGYGSGGLPLTGKYFVYDSTNHRTLLTANPLTWSQLSASFRYAVVYRDTGTVSNSNLIGLIDFGLTKTYDNEDFQLSFPNGVLRIRAGA